jgi:hypothetical protein
MIRWGSDSSPIQRTPGRGRLRTTLARLNSTRVYSKLESLLTNSLLLTSQNGARLHRILEVRTYQGPAMNELDSERIAREIGADESVVADVIARLRLVRGDLSDSGFLDLICDVVRTKVRFAKRDANEDLATDLVRLQDD